MKVTAIQTRPFLPPKDDLLSVLDEVLADVKEKSVIAVSSKVVAIWQGRCVPIDTDKDLIAQKDALAKEEADLYISRGEGVEHQRMSTITGGTLIGSSGVDASSGNGHFILWPKDAMSAAALIRSHIQVRTGVTDLGIIITDSHSTPFRNGTTGITLGYAGFQALVDYRGKEDVFGRELKAERMNVADSLATAANVVMGEGNECTPVVVIEDIPHITFSAPEEDDLYLQLVIPLEHDVFRRFFKDAPWEKGGGKHL